MKHIAMAAALAAVAVGCSSKPDDRSEVRGKVTLGGTAVDEGLVTFHGTNGKQATGGIRPGGEYTVSDAPPGVCQITVRGVPGNTIGVSGAGGPHATSMPGAGPRPSLIPKKYATPGNGLTHDVKPGPQTCDLSLTR